MEASVSFPPNDELELAEAQLVADLDALERARERLSNSRNSISRFALSLLVKYRHGNVAWGQNEVEALEDKKRYRRS